MLHMQQEATRLLNENQQSSGGALVQGGYCPERSGAVVAGGGTRVMLGSDHRIAVMCQLAEAKQQLHGFIRVSAIHKDITGLG